MARSLFSSLSLFLSSRPKRRYPFFGLVLFAIAGILFGNFLPRACFWPFLIVGGSCVLVGCFKQYTIACYLSVLFLFAAEQQWERYLQPSIRYAPHLTNTIFEAEGYVTSEPKTSGTNPNRSHFAIKTTSWNKFPFALNIFTHWKGTPPQLGDVVRIYSQATTISPPRNPGEFDFQNWMLQQGIALELKPTSAAHCEIIHAKAAMPLRRWSLQLHKAAAAKITKGLDDAPTVASLITGITLGDLQHFNDMWKERFRQTGTLHLFSVSGLHIGMVACLLWIILSAFHLPPKFRAILIVICLIAYALITGMRPACIRATIMAIIVFAGICFNRQPQLFNNLCAAAFFILLARTLELFNPGFQLSFTVVTALILGVTPLHNCLANWIKPDAFIPRILYTWREKFQLQLANRIAPALSVTIVAWLASLLLIKSYYYLFSWIAIPLNILLIPNAFLILATAFASIAIGFFLPTIGIILNNANFFFAWISLNLVHFGATLPFSHTYATLLQDNPTSRIVIFDFKNSSVQLVTTPGANLLVNTGNDFHINRTLLPYLKSNGITHIKLLIITHLTNNNIKGLTILLNNISIDKILICPFSSNSSTIRRFEAALLPGQPLHSLASSDMDVKLSKDLSVDILNSPFSSDFISLENPNALRISIDKYRVLILSKAKSASMDMKKINHVNNLQADVVVTQIPLDSSLLKTIQPKTIIINSEPKALPTNSRNSTKNIQIINQNETGAILLEKNNSIWKIHPFLQN